MDGKGESLDPNKDWQKDVNKEKNIVAVLQFKGEEIGKDIFTDSDVDKTGFEKLLQQRDEVSSSSSGESYPDDLSISLTSPELSYGPPSGPKSPPMGAAYIPGSQQQKSDNFSVSTHEATVSKGARPSFGPDFSSIPQKSDDEKLQQLKSTMSVHHSGRGATESLKKLDKAQEMLKELSEDPVIAEKYTELGSFLVQTAKESRTQKILIQTLELESEKWKNTATEKIKENQQLLAEKARLQQENKKLEKGQLDITSSSLMAGSQLQDWVTVEKTQKALNTQEANLDEMKAKLKETDTKLKEVMSANQRWDEYCEKLQREHQIALDAMKREKEKFESLYNSQRLRDEEKSQDVDKVISQVKKRAEALETAREDAIHQLNFEVQKQNDLKTENAELKLQLKNAEEKIVRQREFIMTLQDSARSMMRPELLMMTGNSDETTPSIAAMDVKTLRDQVAVLRTQVTLTKEDFDIERNDRERIHAEKIALQQNYQELKQKVQAMQLQLHEKNREVQILSRDKSSLRADLNAATQEMVRLKRELRIAQQQYNYPTGQMYDYPPHQLRQEFRQPYTPVGPPIVPPIRPSTSPSGFTQQITYGRPLSHEKWSCRQCTFENVPERSSCEICGVQRAPAGSRNISASPMDDIQIYYGNSQRLVPRGREECDSGQLKYSGGIETDTGSLESQETSKDEVTE